MKTPRTSLIALSLLLAFIAVSRAGERPNVLLILADDQGTLDAKCYGSGDLHTPHLDGLARDGVRFSQFYVGAPVCSPSRAALLTGRCPQRAGVPGNVPSEAGRAGMPTEQVTLAEVLKGAGYRTALVGKWHLGTIPECSPNAQGFDAFFGFKAGCIDNWSHFFYWSGPHFHDLHDDEEEVYEDGLHFTRLMVREAKRFLEEKSDRPFFLYLPFNIPHYPLQPYGEYREMYAGKDMPWQRREYAAWVATMDDAIGEVLAELDRLELADDTLVVFLSDHGHSIEVRANNGGGSAGQFRGHKFTLWEGGIRVPCIARFPGRIAAGEVRDQVATSMDWYPTICRYCEVELPGHVLDGKDITSAIESPDAPTPHDVIHWESGSQWAVRRGAWKLVATADKKTDGRELFLSDMNKDATETENLTESHPEVVAKLQELHEEWKRDVAAGGPGG